MEDSNKRERVWSIRGWLDKPKPGEERRLTKRQRNIDVKGWFKEQVLAHHQEGTSRSSFTVVPIRVLDISDSGASVRSQKPTNVGDHVKLSLEIRLPSLEEPLLINATCEVIRSLPARSLTDESLYNIGLRFIDISPEHKKKLTEFLHQS